MTCKQSFIRNCEQNLTRGNLMKFGSDDLGMNFALNPNCSTLIIRMHACMHIARSPAHCVS